MKTPLLIALGLSPMLVAHSANAQAERDTCVASGSSVAPLTQDETAQGWRPLFDGETFSGWHKYGGGPVGSAWTIENGALTLVPGEEPNWSKVSGGDIVTDDVFENFELTLEWRISEAGNSGIFYLVDEKEEYGAAAETGLEMQVLDSERHGDGRFDKHRAGDLYDLIEAPFRAECPVGQWNRVRIIKNGTHVEHWMNGRKLLEVELWSDRWDRLVAGSKFADWKGFGKARRGRIGLQDHGDRVSYRSIAIRHI